jgi:glycerol-3-phosphate acyltransferase PlsY
LFLPVFLYQPGFLFNRFSLFMQLPGYFKPLGKPFFGSCLGLHWQVSLAWVGCFFGRYYGGRMNPSTLNVLLWTVFTFFCGSLPFSVWVSRLFGKDARSIGDGNPGATNAWKAGGWRVGLVAFLLDISKAAAPVGLAYQIWGWHNVEIIPVALAPLLGSVFSPFLKFKGGKSLSVSLGIWIGLTLWEAPLVSLVSLFTAFAIQTLSGWAVVVSLLAIAIYLYFRGASPFFGIILAVQALVLFWTHRFDLRQRPRLRKWLSRKQ